MNNYNLLPDSICFRFGGMQYDMRPAIIGASWGRLTLMYTNFEKSVIIAQGIQTPDEMDEIINDFLEKNEWSLKGQYFYLPNNHLTQDQIINHQRQ